MVPNSNMDNIMTRTYVNEYSRHLKSSIAFTQRPTEPKFLIKRYESELGHKTMKEKMRAVQETYSKKEYATVQVKVPTIKRELKKIKIEKIGDKNEPIFLELKPKKIESNHYGSSHMAEKLTMRPITSNMHNSRSVAASARKKEFPH